MTVQVQDTRPFAVAYLKVDQITRVILSAEFDYAEIKMKRRGPRFLSL